MAIRIIQQTPVNDPTSEEMPAINLVSPQFHTPFTNNKTHNHSTPRSRKCKYDET